MPRLLIGNRPSEDLVGTWGKAVMGWWAQRLLWFIRDGDVLVLPEAPDEEFLSYATELTGTDPASITVVVPPAGNRPGEWLLDPELVDRTRQALAGRTLDEVFALCPNEAVVELARALGAPSAVPGHEFLDQGGALIADSKAIFRTLAAGVGVPLPEGGVSANPESAYRLITRLLDAGRPVILKKEFLGAGNGNEVLTLTEDLKVNGAGRTVVLPDARDAVRIYLNERWEWLTEGRLHRIVVEAYHPGSRAVFAEFRIGDEEIELGGQGEMVAEPVADHSYLPAPGLTAEQERALMAGGRKLSEVLQAMGYRGVLSADAIVVDAGSDGSGASEVLFTEYNGLVTGSTHVYHLGKQLAGADYARDRLLAEYVSWPVASFAEARKHLESEGIAYDRATRTGVVLLNSWREKLGAVPYCVIAQDVEAAERLKERLAEQAPKP
ncbi:peptide ligase PGM1-related protein [Streptomyces sp. NBC_00249]|uniref:preATP grasp domain-containing protein n=1 Tax=Streptomyces sp. NBC_00249 TaxID=2975690 RepID=UPI00224E659A|nr:peptide ligase PGM1-related protein [Streptomyces sp. NBC_00249]MCX5195624.1 peptide ligase PGM1-related protein [Streptomyces sp. NBC_00249]